MSLQPATIAATSGPNRSSISASARSPPPSSTTSCSSAAIAAVSLPPCSSTIALTASRWARYGIVVPLRRWSAWWARAYSSASVKRAVTVAGGWGRIVVTVAPVLSAVSASSSASQIAALVSVEPAAS